MSGLKWELAQAHVWKSEVINARSATSHSLQDGKGAEGINQSYVVLYLFLMTSIIFSLGSQVVGVSLFA